jgi:2-dehydropantoate 2-reductase
MTTFRIGILGAGAVGGYFGARLAARYSGVDDMEVILIAREESAVAMRKNGLVIVTDKGAETFYPGLVTSPSASLGKLDLVLCCVKSYDLESALASLKNCISNDTIIIPFLNGVDAPSRIKKIFPEAQTWEGCAYIVARLVKAGVIRVQGDLARLCFGSANASAEQHSKIKNPFTEAGIHCEATPNISQISWEKFLFISPLANATASLDKCVGDILADSTHRTVLENLQQELKAVALANGLLFDETTLQKTRNLIQALPYSTCPSMYNDLKAGKKSEVNGLTNYVIELGQRLNVPTPAYKTALNAIKTRWPD